MSHAKVFEGFAKRYLETLPNVHIYNQEFEIGSKNSEGNYTLKSGEVVDLIVIAEGANSKTRSELGIEAIKIGQSRLQAAARIHYSYPDTLQLRWEKVNGKDMRSQTLTIERENIIWATTDLDIERITPDKSFGEPESENYRKEQSRLIGLEIKRVVAQNLEIPISKIINSKITSPIGTEELRTFEFQSHISNRAIAGKNVVLFADAVGNGHWAGAGGLETAISNHLRALRSLVNSANSRQSWENALKSYDRTVTENTIEWLKISTPNFDPQWRKHSGTPIQATGRFVCRAFISNLLKAAF
jgi:2-polyprenyl-6-methoxyphenol hydroxylase-like FAD-dependent oxidoreductase